ncbi:amino acid/amide ABC transporter substrate-binding protein, HAAT family [Rhizobiales bacterium GAS188]|nr:amino acid/amide ABC transporter substrate-binding protein, HAAT family [Rhizobiales bacterium GAS188]
MTYLEMFPTRLQAPTRRVAAILALAFAFGTTSPVMAQTSGEPILIGVSGPLTGPNAQYGAQWKTGFDLALEEINRKGGIGGRPLAYVFEDSQSDPRQSVAIAQKFVADPRIVIELGDFSSPASMAASPIYQRAGLVQFGFTNSHPDFTKGGDFMWSNSVSQADEQPALADFAIKKLGLKKLAIIHLNTDWGRSSADILAKSIKEDGAEVVAKEGFLPDEKDFRSTLVRVREANPDGIALIAYYADGALVARQLSAVGITLPVVAVSSVYSPKFLELGGEAVNGIYTTANFFPDDPRPEVQNFVKIYRAKYNKEPDTFGAVAYDTILLVAEDIKEFGTDRKAIRDGLMQIHDVPSVIFGKVKFDPVTRRVAGAQHIALVVRDGKFTLWDGTPVR